MSQQDYQGTIHVNVPISTAYEGVSKRVPEWWALDFEGKAEKPGDEFTVRFGDTFCDFKITEAVPDQKIIWLTTDCYLHFVADKKEWKDTRIIWEFAPENGQTKITMTHEGLQPGIECFDNCTKGWNQFFKNSLYQLLTTNKGTPTR